MKRKTVTKSEQASIMAKAALPHAKNRDPEIGGFIAIMTYFSYLLLIAVFVPLILATLVLTVIDLDWTISGFLWNAFWELKIQN